MLKQLEKKPVDFDFLKSISGKDLKDIQYLFFEELENENVLSRKPVSIILLKIEGENQNKAGHFVTILNDKKDTIEHFDPYGLSLGQEQSITHEDNLLRIAIEKTKKRFIENKIRFQQWKEEIQTCGRWCVARARLRDLTLSQFKDFFEQPLKNMDDKVTLLTFFEN